jgi:O-acetylserine/cysteine efflux transporter
LALADFRYIRAAMTPNHLLLMILICLIWGFNFVVCKIGILTFPPLFFTGLRFLEVALVLIPFLKPVPGQMGRIFLLSVVAGSLNFALFFLGFAQADDVSTVAIAVQLSVPFSTLLSVVMLNEQIRLARITGIVLAFAGVAIISFSPRAFAYIDGLALVILSAFVGAFGNILMRRIHSVGALQLQGWLAMMAWPPLMALSFLIEDGQWQVLASADLQAYGALLYAGFAATLIGHAGMYYLLQRYEVSEAAPLTLMAPIFGVFFGVSLMGDEFTWRIALGGVLTLCGVAIIMARGRRLVDLGS